MRAGEVEEDGPSMGGGGRGYVMVEVESWTVKIPWMLISEL